jgi:hypothetical protein
MRIPLRRIACLSLLLALIAGYGHARAAPPEERVAALRRGVNITGWFRYPVSRDPDALRRYVGDDALRGLARTGFTWVRLAVEPALAEDPTIR